jgi:hypothetical protein
VEPITQIESLVNHGRYLEARKAAKDQLKSSDDLRLKQLYALALSKSGTPEAARDFLEPVHASGARDPETAGILGGIYKELFRKSQSSSFATSSRDTYLANFLATGSYYTGINAASMSAILMQSSKSKELAKQIIGQLQDSARNYWEVATLAEAYLLIKERQRALDTYASARKMAGSDWGPIMSVHRQLWLLNHYIPVAKELLSMFEPPRVAAFVGHMIDHPDRSTPRFPPSIEPAVAAAIRQNIEILKLQVGYCALACGSDILFAEAMAQHGGTVNILLPFDVSDFVEHSVRFAGEHWVERFQNLVRQFPVSFVTQERYDGDDNLFSLQGKIILGSSILQSRSFQSDPVLLTVLSQADLEIKEGGTRNMINNWPYPKDHVNIGIETLSTGTTGTRKQSAPMAKRIAAASAIRFLIWLDTAKLNALEREKLLSIADTKAERDSMYCQWLAESDQKWILSFDYETGAIEMLKVLHGYKASKKLGLALHAGPVQYKNDRATGPVADELRKIASFTSPGMTLASHNFSALLALLPGEFQVEYTSNVAGQYDQEVAVYSVSII